MNKYFKDKRRKSMQYSKIRLIRKSPITRDRFSTKKIPEDLHSIVIGSGISGLTTAGLLARAGKRVLVLEGHYIAGGCTHTFTDKGFEFDTGLHYVGKLRPKAHKILDAITKEKIIWDQMGYENKDYVYDRLVLLNRHFKLRPDSVNWLKDMCRYFPKEKEALRKYVNLVKKVAEMKVWFLGKLIKSNMVTR